MLMLTDVRNYLLLTDWLLLVATGGGCKADGLAAADALPAAGGLLEVEVWLTDLLLLVACWRWRYG